jgi:DNA-binding NarL/FixJ family response regulator
MAYVNSSKGADATTVKAPTTFYLIEDSKVARGVLRETLSRFKDFAVVGEADNAETAMHEVLSLSPDVIVVDINLPGLDGIQATKQIKSRLPKTHAIILTWKDDDASMFHAFEAGADAYLTKDDFSPQKLEHAIRDINRGSAWLDPVIAKRVLSKADSVSSTARLSDAERQVLRLVAEKSIPLSQQELPVRQENLAGDLEQSDEEDSALSKDWNSFLQRLQRFNPSPC